MPFTLNCVLGDVSDFSDYFKKLVVMCWPVRLGHVFHYSSPMNALRDHRKFICAAQCSLRVYVVELSISAVA